ncbi:hypothetical protein GCM10023160_29480 [Brachybacterium paraconglomeratum]|uniref:SGNH/GDSL hydrolase family protein n=1 Tax=Brachybacterium paraconglomeratum TaxID=173362 RepID=UPI0031ECC39C
MFTGDSITHGALHTRGYLSWTQLVEHHLHHGLGRADLVMNTAISGDTILATANPAAGGITPGVLTESGPRIHDLRPDVVTVMIGMNDCALEVPLPDYTVALRTLVADVRARGALPILATSPPILGIDPRRPRYPEFMDQVRQVAAELTVPLVDNHRRWEHEGLTHQTTLWGDAIHPSPEGHRHMAQHFLRTLGMLDDDAPLARASGERHAGLDPVPLGATAPAVASAPADPVADSTAATDAVPGADSELDAAATATLDRMRTVLGAPGEDSLRSRPLLVLGDTGPMALAVDGHQASRSWLHHLEEVRRFEHGHRLDYFHLQRLGTLRDGADALAPGHVVPHAAVLLVPTAEDLDAAAAAATTTDAAADADVRRLLGELAAALAADVPGALVLRHPLSRAAHERWLRLGAESGLALFDLTSVLPSRESAMLLGIAGMVDIAGAEADLAAASLVLEQLGWSTPAATVARLDPRTAALCP